MTRAPPSGEVRPCPRDGGRVLKALIVGLCALVLAGAGSAAQTRPTSRTLVGLSKHLRTIHHDRQVIVFFERRAWLLTDPRFAREARRQLALRRRNLEATRRRVARIRRTIRRQAANQHRLTLAQLPPHRAICSVFGRFCSQALTVARCESGLSTSARNGQYLGLFQMGSTERRLFGHGSSAVAQARAAHRYFVFSGRDWSPWSCKPLW